MGNKISCYSNNKEDSLWISDFVCSTWHGICGTSEDMVLQTLSYSNEIKFTPFIFLHMKTNEIFKATNVDIPFYWLSPTKNEIVGLNPSIQNWGVHQPNKKLLIKPNQIENCKNLCLFWICLSHLLTKSRGFVRFMVCIL